MEVNLHGIRLGTPSQARGKGYGREIRSEQGVVKSCGWMLVEGKHSAVLKKTANLEGTRTHTQQPVKILTINRVHPTSSGNHKGRSQRRPTANETNAAALQAS